MNNNYIYIHNTVVDRAQLNKIEYNYAPPSWYTTHKHLYYLT